MFYLAFMNLEWMALNFETTICNLLFGFHHHHTLKCFIKTDGFSHKTALSDNGYYLLSFHQWRARVLNDLPRSHTGGLVYSPEKYPTILILLSRLTFRVTIVIFHRDENADLKFNIEEVVTAT